MTNVPLRRLRTALARARWASRPALAVAAALLSLAAAAPAASAQEQTASIVLGDPNEEHGLVQAEQPDGRTTAVTVGDRSARATAPGDDPSWGRYMYFGLDDELASDGYYVARVEVEYLDEGTQSFGLQYDSNDCTATLNGAYDSAGDVQRSGTGNWKTATFDLPDARFANRENGGSDFRFAAGGSTLTIHSVTVTILEDRTTHPPAPEPGVAEPVEQVSLERSAERLALDNGYVHAEFDLAHPQIDVIRADFGGRRRYAADLTSAGAGPLGQSGVVLERDGPDGAHASSEAAGDDLRVSVLRDDPQEVVLRIDGIVDDAGDPLVTSSWTLALKARERAFRLQTSTRALRTADVGGVRIAAHLSGSSVHGLFERGVVQMMNSADPDFASSSPLERAYFLGAPGGGAIDVASDGQRATVLHSRAACGNAPTGGAARTGVELVLAGSHPEPDRWTRSGWSAAAPTRIAAGQRWRTDATIAANGYDFPAGGLVEPGDNLPEGDLRAIYTAVYGTAAGVLGSYGQPGAAYPTLATPNRSYGAGNSFFDPDAWEVIRALLYSGDRYLQREARRVIERSGQAILASGQIPHHFDGADPTYVAISGATQTGPNIFWISSALDYAGATGDYDWLRTQMPRIEHALAFITDRYDPGVQLISAPGPLWIDVFIRENYTADTNAFMVGLLRRIADAEAFLGDAGRAADRRGMADDIAAGMNERLWSGDHYVTQLNPDGSTRDLVDYDANLLAVAFGAAPPDRARAILDRVDAGPCTHGRATWVSERYYGPADTYNGNTGDSATAMGRIGWADAGARRRVGDLATYRDAILDPLRADLLERTWLTERYDCAGNAIRAPYYHEYPELVAMLLREVTYGIDLGLGKVTIDPFGPRDYRYHVGDVDVDYSARSLDLSLPGSGQRAFELHGLVAGARYAVVATGSGSAEPQQPRADAQGTLRFDAPVGADTTIRVRLQD
jgi:hypothetical protein